MICRYKSASVLRDDAKGFLNGKYKRAIAVLILYVAISYAASVALEGVQSLIVKILVSAGQTSLSAAMVKDVLVYLTEEAVTILLEVIVIGLSLCFLKMGCNTMPAASDMFTGFRENFGKNFVIALAVKGSQLLIMMPGSVLYDFYNETGLKNYLFGAAAAEAVGAVVSLFIWLNLSISYFIVFDFPNYTAGEALSAAVKKMKGNKGRLFKMELCFIPYYLLGVLTCGIGFLWIVPLVYEARAQFYLDVMNPQKVSGEWERAQ